MNAVIEPGLLRGAVTAPPSKSHAHRLLIAAALSGQDCRILRPGDSEDIAATVRCLQALGADVRREGEGLSVRPGKGVSSAALDCGESGSTLRFLLPVLCAMEGDFTLSGRGRLPERPLEPLLSALRAHGAAIAGDRLPLRVSGGLRSGEYDLPGSVSSQYFSGLLFALPLLAGDSTLRFTSPLESAPYVEMTLSVLRQFGIRAEKWENGWRVPGNQRYSAPEEIGTEGDWSAAAFFLGADALGSDVRICGLDPASCQGDRAVAGLLQRIGEEIDFSDTPDLLPIVAAAAAASPGKTTRLTGAARLRIKESDRLSAMADAIRCLGGEAEELPDGLTVRGTKLAGGTVDGRHDHRIVMSAAVAATVCAEPVTVLGAEAVNKSYPGFWRDFAALGGKVHV